jgi:predicted lipoprotein
VIWLVLGCTGKDDPGSSGDTSTPATDGELRREVVTAVVDGVVLRHYGDLRAATTALATTGAGFCASMDEAGLAAFRQAWSDAHAPLKRAEIVRFGPGIEEPYRLQPKMDMWPPNARAVDDYLAGTGGFLQTDFDAMGTATRGFPALEVLLWAPGDATLAAFEADPRRCPYAVGLADDLDVLAGRMVDAWETDWRDRMIHPEDHPDDAYDTLQHVIDEWVNRMIFTVEDLRSTRLGKPVGDSSGGEPLPDTIESRFSGRSLQDCRDVLSGVRDVAGTGDALGIHDLLTGERRALVPRLEQAQSDAELYLGEILEPLELAITSDRVAIGSAQDALLRFQVLLQVDLAQALSVTLAFNDNDGD